MEKSLTENVAQDIIKYIRKHQPEVSWYNEEWSRKVLMRLLQDKDSFIEDILLNNVDHLCYLENEFINHLQVEWDEYDSDMIADLALEHISVDINLEGMYKNIPDLAVVIPVYSDFDCCNSVDSIEIEDSYLYQVYQRVTPAVNKEDYIWEFRNGAYGGALFMFAFRTGMKKLLDMKAGIPDAESITVPKGTQFGFHSSFQGATSLFEKRTVSDLTLPVTGDSKYDTVDILADIEQETYSIEQVYGTSDFLDQRYVKVNIPELAKEAV